jgi:hypothetical protein
VQLDEAKEDIQIEALEEDLINKASWTSEDNMKLMLRLNKLKR